MSRKELFEKNVVFLHDLSLVHSLEEESLTFESKVLYIDTGVLMERYMIGDNVVTNKVGGFDNGCNLIYLDTTNFYWVRRCVVAFGQLPSHVSL